VARALRLRYGRGGRIYLDRRDAIPRPFSNLPRSTLFDIDEPMDVDTENPEQDENRCRSVERWRFDMDDSPAIVPEGSEEQDRVLVNDYDER
jgi:enhancer of polycomb-like protein